MLWSRLFIPTLREAPAGIGSLGLALLTRAGYVRGDTHLFLATRSLDRIRRLIERHLPAQDLYSPKTPLPAVARELRSYKQLPQTWRQFRDASLEAYRSGQISEAFTSLARAILKECGVAYLEAATLRGTAFAVISAAGEDTVARAGAYTALASDAVSEADNPAAPDPEGDFSPEPFHTPDRKSIAELAEFTGLPESSHIKSVVMAQGEVLFLILLRGDHQLSVEKLEHAVRLRGLIPAGPEQIRAKFGAGAGSLGPVGLNGIRIVTDNALRGRRNMIAGANRDDYHLRHVTPGKDFPAEFLDLRQAQQGEMADGGALRMERAVILGDCSSEWPDAELHVTAESGKEVDLQVTSCRLFLDRLLRAAADQYHDADGLILPAALAPFDLIVTPVDYATEAQRAAAMEIAAGAEAAGLTVLIDDRLERPGVKFKDADLIGIPWRVTIGKKVDQGMVEVVERSSKQKTEVAPGQAIEFIRTRH